MDTAVLTLHGRGDGGEGGAGRVQAGLACYVHPLPGTSHGGRSKTSTKKTTSLACTEAALGGG